jgi:hypothetical protein
MPNPTERRTTTSHHRAVFREADGRLHISSRTDRGATCSGWFFATEASLPAGVALATLEVHREESGPAEVLVQFKLGSDSPAARERLTRWAASVGRDRLWFADTYVDLHDLPAPAACVGHCDCCETTFREDGPAFLEQVRKAGGYPRICPVCGAPLAAWDVEYLTEEYQR